MSNAETHESYHTFDGIGNDASKDEAQTRYPVMADYLPLVGWGEGDAPPYPEIDDLGDISVSVYTLTAIISCIVDRNSMIPVLLSWL